MFFSRIYQQKCFDLSGRCSHGTKETVHACGDGPGSDGEESVQGEVHGATRGCQMDGNDPSFKERSQLGQEKTKCLEVVRCSFFLIEHVNNKIM